MYGNGTVDSYITDCTDSNEYSVLGHLLDQVVYLLIYYLTYIPNDCLVHWNDTMNEHCSRHTSELCHYTMH